MLALGIFDPFGVGLFYARFPGASLALPPAILSIPFGDHDIARIGSPLHAYC
jgi:hypothetical protein